jgi:hypothetical protein
MSNYKVKPNLLAAQIAPASMSLPEGSWKALPQCLHVAPPVYLKNPGSSGSNTVLSGWNLSQELTMIPSVDVNLAIRDFKQSLLTWVKESRVQILDIKVWDLRHIHATDKLGVTLCDP